MGGVPGAVYNVGEKSNSQLLHGKVKKNKKPISKSKFAGLIDIIVCETGLHCVPLVHDQIGAKQVQGAVRLRIGTFDTVDHI